MRRVGFPSLGGTGAVSRLLLALALAIVGMAGPAPGQQAPADTKPAVVLPPEVEAKLTEFLKAVVAAKRKLLSEEANKTVEDVKKVTGLDGEPVKALQTAAQQAADLSLPDWTTNLGAQWRSMPAQQLENFLPQAMLQAQAYANADWPGKYVHPAEQPVWKDALRQVLSPGQLAAWEKVQADRKAAFEKEIGSYLDAQAKRVNEQYLQTMLVKSQDIARVLGWPKERAGELDALARSAVDQATQKSREMTRQSLMSMTEAQRLQIVKSQGGYFVSGETPEKEEVWRDGLAKLLSDDEQKQWQAAQEERKRRRVQAAGKMLLALADEKVALTAAQRQKLEPLTERLVRDEPSLFPETIPGNYYAFATPTFYSLAAKAPAADLQAVLDPLQLARWKEMEAVAAHNQPGLAGRGLPRGAPMLADAAATPPDAGDAADVEQSISDYLFPKAEQERDRVDAFMVLQAEDAARTLALSPGVSERLRTAAEGAAEENLVQWESYMEQNVRAQLQDATALNIKMRLDSMPDYSYARVGEPPENSRLWKKAVASELTEPQRTAWQKVVDERLLYRNAAIAGFILAEFDQQDPLSAEQWEKLGPLLTGVLQESGPDIDRTFSYNSDQNRWFLLGYSMFMPLLGVPEDVLKSILTKEQYERWTGSNEFTNASNYWANIQRMHQQRVKK
jgi:hypothetical protein